VSTILQNRPLGRRVGIAISGGLETGAVTHGRPVEGAIPSVCTENPGQPGEPDFDDIPRRAIS
jgi:argininosuccinate synthase